MNQPAKPVSRKMKLKALPLNGLFLISSSLLLAACGVRAEPEIAPPLWGQGAQQQSNETGRPKNKDYNSEDEQTLADKPIVDEEE